MIDRRKLLLTGLALPFAAPVLGQTPPPNTKPGESWDDRWKRLEQEDFGHLFRYRDDDDRILVTHAKVGIVFLGDSVTEGWRDKRPGFFTPGRVGRGIGGQTTPQMLVRMQQDVIALRPRVLHLMAATNDIAGNTGPMTPEQTQDMFRALVALAKAHGIRVILASIPPAAAFPWKPGFDPRPPIAALNRWLKTFAARQGATWIDYHPALAGPDGGMKPGFASDGVHPTVAGYQAMEGALARVLRRMGV